MYGQLLFFFSALGAFNGIILSGYFAFLAKKKVLPNYFLAGLLFMLSIRVVKSVFFHFNPDLANWFIQVGLSACVLIGPFLFLYVKSEASSTTPNWVVHVVPYIVVVTILGGLYPYVVYTDLWRAWIVKGIYGQWLAYNLAAFRYVGPIWRRWKDGGRVSNLDIWLSSVYAGVFIIWLAYNIAAYTSYIVGALSFTFILYLITLLFIFRKKSGGVFFQEKEKYKNKAIEQAAQAQIAQKLSLIVEKEMFLQPDFTLEEAAKVMKVTKHTLSQYVNETLGKSFSHLMNEYRVEKAKRLLASEKSLTIESIGYDSGFNSKSTFFTTFKKITGKTPADYQKNAQSEFETIKPNSQPTNQTSRG